MNCKKFNEILSADYIDGELNQEQLKAADEHISACKDCGQFKEALMKNAVNPFKAVVKTAPPEYIWNNIRTSIAANSFKNPVLHGFFKRYMSFPGISIAAAAIVLALGSLLYFNQPITVFAKHSAAQSGYSTDENYFAYLYEGMDNNEQEPAAAEEEDLLS